MKLPPAGLADTGAACGTRRATRVHSQIKEDLANEADVVVREPCCWCRRVVAQQDVVKQTQTTMKATGRAMAAFSARWSRAKSPTIRRPSIPRWRSSTDTAKKLPTMFPKASRAEASKATTARRRRSGRTRPASTAKIAQLRQGVTDAKGKIKDLDSLKASLPAIGKRMRRLPRDLPPQETEHILPNTLWPNKKGRTPDASAPLF